jgi:tetratricopeptide repeat protein
MVPRAALSASRRIFISGVLGSALTDTGDYGAAERVLAGALSRGREATDPNTRARLYWSQSRLLAEQGKEAAAERYAQRTLETLRTTEDTYALGHAIEMLARIQIELGRPA